MKIAIYDNEVSFHDILLKILESEFDDSIVDFYTELGCLSKCLQKLHYDCFFISVEISNLDGLKLIEFLNKEHTCYVILVSSYLPFAVLGYKLRVYRFLDRTAFFPQIKHILADLKVDFANLEVNNFLTIVYRGFTYKFQISQIQYCISMEHYIFIESNGMTYKIRYDIKKISQKFLLHGFVEVYKGTFVNCKYVSRISDKDNMIFFTDNKKLHGSKNGIRKLKECLKIS